MRHVLCFLSFRVSAYLDKGVCYLYPIEQMKQKNQNVTKLNYFSW